MHRCLLNRHRRPYFLDVYISLQKISSFGEIFCKGKVRRRSAIFYMRPTCPKKVRTTSGIRARRNARAISSFPSCPCGADVSSVGASQLQPPSWVHAVPDSPSCISSSIRHTLNELRRKTKKRAWSFDLTRFYLPTSPVYLKKTSVSIFTQVSEIRILKYSHRRCFFLK